MNILIIPETTSLFKRIITKNFLYIYYKVVTYITKTVFREPLIPAQQACNFDKGFAFETIAEPSSEQSSLSYVFL